MGVVRFTRRLCSLINQSVEAGPGGVDLLPLDRTVALVERDIERLKFNTAIARLMEATSWAAATRRAMSADEWSHVASTLALLLGPFAPHLAEELWSRLGREYSIHQQAWPTYREHAFDLPEITLVVQVNGKVRARLRAKAGLTQSDAIELALGQEAITKHLTNGEPSHAVYVPDRLINLVS
jgi:leucyl-tRNA synthetase